MKGFVAISTPTPAKRRWRAPATVVLVLVFFSLLVPLDFLLGFHTRFPSVYVSDDPQLSETRFRNFGHLDGVGNFPQEGASRIEKLVKRFAPTVSKDFSGNNISKDGEFLSKNLINNSAQHLIVAQRDTASNSQPQGSPPLHKVSSVSHIEMSTKLDSSSGNKGNSEGQIGEEIRKSCQLELGSYCLWSVNHKEVLKDSKIKKLKDQLFVARAYFPTLAKLRGQLKLSRELKQNIQEHERILSDVIVDAELPKLVERKIQKMEHTITRAKTCTVDCNNVDKKLRQILDLTEDEANFHMKQSAFLYQLGVQTMPKSLHCLSMRLTVESFKSLSTEFRNSLPNKLDTSELMNFAIFSKNILAAAVTINSTVVNSEVNRNMVFHVVTDTQNYYAMKLWFTRNSFKEATVIVINFEELNLSAFHNTYFAKLSFSEEFRISIPKTDQRTAQMSTEYITVFGHSHFLLPEMFKNLRKVVVLDDDVVVQRDLSSLWKLNLEGKVNGAVEICRLRLGHLKSYLGRNSYDTNSCAWMSGLNIIDLDKWREHNVTGAYLQLLESFQIQDELSLRAAALPASLLAFKNFIYPLGERWSLSGLGHNYGVDMDAINSAISLHYNGNMKPWLDLGIPKYKEYWKKFLTHDERFMNECKVNP